MILLGPGSIVTWSSSVVDDFPAPPNYDVACPCRANGVMHDVERAGGRYVADSIGSSAEHTPSRT